MILFFSVTNFRSIYKQVTLDFENDSYKDHSENTSEFGSKSYSKIISMFGPNASGKSCFINALADFKGMIQNGNTFTPQTPLPYLPFSFCENNDNPSSFEMGFIYNDIKYRYGFSFKADRIVEEHLFYSPKGREDLVFQRADERYNFTNQEFEKYLKPIIDKNIKNKLFLVTAAQLNFEIAKSVIDFVCNNIFVVIQNSLISERTNCSPAIYYEPILKDSNYKQFLIQLLQSADINVEDINIKPVPVSNRLISPLKINNSGIGSFTFDAFSYDVKLAHKVNNSSYLLDLSQESQGTMMLFSLGHLFYDAFNRDVSLFMDELDVSLHPSILKFLVQAFIDNASSQSQLVFTTHNTSIMSDEFFRRDQIFFFDKDENCSTRLSSLASFGVRREEKFERDYLLGRYGSVPAVVSFLKESCDGKVQ